MVMPLTDSKCNADLCFCHPIAQCFILQATCKICIALYIRCQNSCFILSKMMIFHRIKNLSWTIRQSIPNHNSSFLRSSYKATKLLGLQHEFSVNESLHRKQDIGYFRILSRCFILALLWTGFYIYKMLVSIAFFQNVRIF